MHWKRYFAALTVALVATFAVDILLNAVLLRDLYKSHQALWLPAEQLNARVPLGLASVALIQAFLGVLFVRIGWRGIRRGLEFAVWLSLAAVAGVAGLASLVPWPTALLVSMAVQQTADNVLLGVVFGWLYRDAS